MKNFFVDLWKRMIGFVMVHGKTILAFLSGAAIMMLVLMPRLLKEDGKLEQLEGVLEEYFVEDVDPEALEDAAAAAMVDAIGDRWSYYMTAETYQASQQTMKSQYVGVGITISLREDGIGYDILKVETNSPAAGAGILAGDILIGADDVYVSEAGAEDMKNAVAGEKGTQVELTVLRDGAEMKFTMNRDTVLVDVAQGVMLEDHIGLVTIESFRSRCADETIEAIEELLEQGAEALIFDVRFNPGGYTTELIDLLDYLLPEGPIFRTESYSGEVNVDYSDADCLEMPIAVLVNGDSYSAAEFFAAALQEYEAATIVGEKTFGKGYYQTDFLLSDGSAVNLSIGKYYTPNGLSLIGIGVTPDEEITVDEETASLIYAGTLDPMEDPQILAAIDTIKTGN
ncbi:MAG: S41 family peptidase [Oscillospiraceae bacterium]|nr:S41 family peptidase [Oscillospiraceae bacterium]